MTVCKVCLNLFKINTKPLLKIETNFYNINEKKSTCKKEYCFFTGSYEFIDKFDYIFKTERINKENIRIVKEELEYISQNQKKDGTTEIEENKDNKDIKK